mmetsp:Transcript_59912/g.126830  ORF Transcript_59912/g.126830 Transcript_59912/m.126830 type:complete len:548 (+) Transcript_59912:75-1718(+)
MLGSNIEVHVQPSRNLALVEVRKNLNSTTWYQAQLLDLSAGRALVSFADGVWPDREVPCYSVRPRPEPQPEDQVALDAGGCVEVMVDPSNKSPMGWTLGQLTSFPRPDGKIVVRIGTKEYAVAPEALRPLSQEPVLDPLVLVRKAVSVPESLRKWLMTEDAQGCLEQVRFSSALGLAGAGSATGGILSDRAIVGEDAEPPNAVILLGTEDATRRGEMLLKIHLMHQGVLESYHARWARKLEVLKSLKGIQEEQGAIVRLTFQVQPSLVGRICGKGGERIKRISAEYGVKIQILDGTAESEPRTVLIAGETDEDVQKAREEFELTLHDYVVEPEQVAWVLSKASEVAKTSGLVSAKWSDQAKALQLCGTSQQIDDAVLLLDNHREYFSVFEEIKKQKEEINRSFEALDEAAVQVGLAPPGGGSRKARAKSVPKRSSSAKARARTTKSAAGKGDEVEREDVIHSEADEGAGLPNSGKGKRSRSQGRQQADDPQKSRNGKGKGQSARGKGGGKRGKAGADKGKGGEHQAATAGADSGTTIAAPGLTIPPV